MELYAEAVKLDKEKWQPVVKRDGVDEPLVSGAVVKTKKQAEADALVLLTTLEVGAPEPESDADVPTAETLAQGIADRVEPNAKGTYSRILVEVNGRVKNLAYANPRKKGVLLDYSEGEGRATLLVTADNVDEGRALLQRLASQV